MKTGSHPEAGAVCVRADHGEAISRKVASAHSEGDEAGVVPGHKVLKRANMFKPRSFLNVHSSAEFQKDKD